MGDKKIREVFNVEAERRAYMADKRIGEGRPLLEVFKVLINDIDGEDPGNLYGTITVTNGGKSQYVYKRGKSDSEKVKPGGSATLNGPDDACISASDDFTIDVHLMDRDRFPDLSKDDEVSKGNITWSSYNSSIDRYDVLLSEEISGDKGMATIFYAVFSNAVQAFVEIRLQSADNESKANIYGVVAVSYGGRPGFENHKNHELFRRSSDRAVDLRPVQSQLIPLDRSFVAVPRDSSLLVSVEIFDHDKFPDPSPDDEIAKGNAIFYAQLSGTSEKRISGAFGFIEAKVTWTA